MRAGRSSWCRRCRASPIGCSAWRRWPAPATSKARARSLQDLRARHIKVSEVITDPSLRRSRSTRSTREFDELERVVSALAVLQEVSPRWLDALAATGEILSSQIVAAALTSHKLLAT